MKNVICDICGTAYPATAKKCPICGSSREYALENEENVSADLDFLEEEEVVRSGSRRKNREIFDFDEVNQVKSSGKLAEEDDFDDEEEPYEEESGANVGLVIVLVVLIVLLLVTAGFFFLRYLLPNLMPEEPQSVPTTVPVQTQMAEPTDLSRPCTNLMMDGGKMELGRDSKKLLNVRVYPEDTTDQLIYSSADPSVVTVSEDGTVTAVGEGQTVVTVICGNQQINCNVTVDFSIGEETVPDENIPSMQVDPEAGTTATDATAAAETTVATEETAAPDMVLKLKKSSEDITIGFNHASVTLELDCDIKPEDIKWFTMDSTIAIVNNGVVTSTGLGQTKIYGEYGGQQIMCIVRCVF